MSSIAALVEGLRSDRTLFTAWCGLPEPSISGLLAREAFDAVTVDMQHGAIDFAEAVQALPLIGAAGKPAIVRIPVGQFAMGSRFLDAGASALIAPMINTVEDARLFASFSKFPPVGERSWGPHGALALSALQPKDYFAAANGFSLTFAMVETRESLAIIDDILAVDGIDAIFIGPSDLSIALSGGASLDPASSAVDQALDHAVARARAAGKFTGVYAATGERGRQLAAKGYDLVALGSDGSMLRAGAQAALTAAGSGQTSSKRTATAY